MISNFRSLIHFLFCLYLILVHFSLYLWSLFFCLFLILVFSLFNVRKWKDRNSCKLVKSWNSWQDWHEGVGAHTGYHKLFKDIETTYHGIPRKVCMEFIKGRVQCACKKTEKRCSLTPMTSKYFMHRGQLDLVCKLADPDGDYCWIGHYIYQYTISAALKWIKLQST